MGYILRKEIGLKEWGIGLAAFAVTFFAWIFIQFPGDTVSNIFSIYANPHSTDLLASIKANFTRFFTEAQPIYFFWMLIAWFISIALRVIKKVKIPAVEWGAAVFSLFILLAYLRTIGYYRYFFPAQFFAILFVVRALNVYFPRKVISVTVASALIIFQLYQTFFTSWVAVHYKDTRTAQVKALVETLPITSHFYLYQAPEIALFLPTSNYSQYLEVTKTIILGYNTLKEISDGTAPFVITTEDKWGKEADLFKKYVLKEKAERYVVLTPQP